MATLYRHLHGQFVSPRADRRGGTFSLKDSRGRTQYFSGGRRVSAATWANLKQASREEGRPRTPSYDPIPSSFTPVGDRTAEEGTHIKQMRDYQLDELQSLPDLRAELASLPWVRVDEDDIIITGITPQPDGTYLVHWYVDFSGYYDDEA